MNKLFEHTKKSGPQTQRHIRTIFIRQSIRHEPPWGPHVWLIHFNWTINYKTNNSQPGAVGINFVMKWMESNWVEWLEVNPIRSNLIALNATSRIHRFAMKRTNLNWIGWTELNRIESHWMGSFEMAGMTIVDSACVGLNRMIEWNRSMKRFESK